MEYLERYVTKKHNDFIHEMIGNPIALNRRLNYYKTRIERIEGTWWYPFFRRMKDLFMKKR
jgi:hypothetical protein